ncbi:hypothetical protein [Ectopseudomonas oleovorans]|jgi:hypothetical protein|uniref:hypothetical protein n=1 Tax=Ectopseudomonas oleovorans TaxID=301 RepID=UPI00241CDFA1|nr:hypothetical protein [Pseudomonas oleovorans]
MNTLANKVSAFIQKFEAVHADDFAEYFAQKVGTSTFARTSVRIEKSLVIFSDLENINIDYESYFSASPANDSPYESVEYLECA